jgi:hypothetical protein
LSDAFEARDLEVAMACFADAPDVMFAGSDADDYALGTDAIAGVLHDIFARDESYSWSVRTIEHADGGGFRIVLADITTTVRRADDVEVWPLQLGGVLQADGECWRWRNVSGVLPCPAAVAERFGDRHRSQPAPAPATRPLGA